MKNFLNFSGIFATAFVTTTLILLASCSQDDDYYDSEMYTLAEMGTRLAEEGESGDPGGNQPSTTTIYVTTEPVTEYHELYFYPSSVFNSSDFQHSPFVAIDPFLYSILDNGIYCIEADVTVRLKRVNNIPTVISFSYASSYPTFDVTDVYLKLEENLIPDKYRLYATATLDDDDGGITQYEAFIPTRIYK